MAQRRSDNGPEAGEKNPETAGGKLTENIMHFARVLRRAGLPIGPGQVLEAVRAVHAVGLGRREDFYWTLHSVFVNRRDQRELFDQAFHIFWRNPEILERMMSLILPDLGNSQNLPPAEELSRRVAEALAPQGDGGAKEAEEQELVLDAAMTWSPDEVLQEKDFEKMTAEEVKQAVASIKRMRLPIMEVKTRRYAPNPAGRRADLRRTMRAALRTGGDFIPLVMRSRKTRRPPLVVICDVSGSMDRYSRMLIHFLHALTNDRDRVFTFLFGTRLTNVTRYLRYKDVDHALERVGDAVEDWAGGTRIGHCLHEFNTHWSRRVLAQGAIVLLISDGVTGSQLS